MEINWINPSGNIIEMRIKSLKGFPLLEKVKFRSHRFHDIPILIDWN